MHCYVYKGDNRDDHYLYLNCDIAVAEVPEALLTMLGELSLVTEFELSVDRQLPQAEAHQVMQDIENQGFYLQMPPRGIQPELNFGG